MCTKCFKSTKNKEQFILTGRHKEGAKDVHIRGDMQRQRRKGKRDLGRRKEHQARQAGPTGMSCLKKGELLHVTGA